MKGEDTRQIEQMRDALGRPPSVNAVGNTLPIIVPRAYFQLGIWPGPYALLRHPELAVTWVILEPHKTMLYVNHDQADLWEHKGINWREDAKRNLIERSRAQLWTHERKDSNGQYSFVAFMHDDGLGSSRVLLRELLEASFVKDYKIALPDRSCALAFPSSVDSIGEQSLEAFVEGMHSGATAPMLSTILSPDDLDVEGPGGR